MYDGAMSFGADGRSGGLIKVVVGARVLGLWFRAVLNANWDVVVATVESGTGTGIGSQAIC